MSRSLNVVHSNIDVCLMLMLMSVSVDAFVGCQLAIKIGYLLGLLGDRVYVPRVAMSESETAFVM